MTGEPLGALRTPLGAIEVNVLVAGVEAAVAGWLGFALITGESIIPEVNLEWSWVFALWGVVILVGLVLLGFAVEGLAGALEWLLTRRWWGKDRGKLWPRYEKWIRYSDIGWTPAQRWIWESPQASDEFARRRLRLLIAGNTTFVSLVLTLNLVFWPLFNGARWSTGLLSALLAGLVATMIFAWVFMSAQRGYNVAITDAGKIGPP